MKMRLNQFLATNSGLSRRQADTLIAAGRVRVNRHPANLGQAVSSGDQVLLDDKLVQPTTHTYLTLNKPVGYICSRRQQGTKPTVYALLPAQYHHLKPIGRLDGDSSGLLVLTNDGQLAHRLTHPRYAKTKRYLVTLDRAISSVDLGQLESGVALSDGPSHLRIRPCVPGSTLTVEMTQGRNRQIRRTFEALSYNVINLTRLAFGRLELDRLKLGPGQFCEIKAEDIL
jgi:23S rRNA pseudouridine2605 synthase